MAPYTLYAMTIITWLAIAVASLLGALLIFSTAYMFGWVQSAMAVDHGASLLYDSAAYPVLAADAQLRFGKQNGRTSQDRTDLL